MKRIFTFLGKVFIYNHLQFGGAYILFNNSLFLTGMCKTEEDEAPSTEEDSQSFHGVGVCKWFNVRMGFGFLSMTNREGVPLDEPVDVFVHQVGPLCYLGAETEITCGCFFKTQSTKVEKCGQYLQKERKDLTSSSEIIPPEFNNV